MAQPSTTTKIIESCQISPPPGSVPPISLPLTFFDIPWLVCIPMRRLFFFDLPHPTHHFTLTVLPKLKHSLSLALRHFFPYAADLARPAPPHKPHLLFSEGGSVSFAVAESTVDFNHLLSNDPRDVTDCHPLLPKLPPPSSDGGDTRVSSLLAIQVTVFPNSGVSIGLTFNHVVADGRAFNYFVKSWALLCRTASSQQPLESPPTHDRYGLSDPYGLEPIFLKHWWAVTSSFKGYTDRPPAHFENKVRSTFELGRAHIAKLKQHVLAQQKEEALTWHLSSFVVTVAYTWVQLIKSEKTESLIGDRDEDKTYHLCFVADCRNRNGFEISIPDTRFGNCLAICFVPVKKSELLSENGFLRAAKSIGERVREFHGAPLGGADKWMSDWKEISESGNLVTVAGSPNLRVYDTDFGWGRPRKSQVVQNDVSGAIALSDCRDEEGGIEIGLAFDKDKMNNFSALFERGLELV